MKHLKLYEELSINPPIMNMFTQIDDFWAFLNQYPEIEEMFDKNPQLEFILPKNGEMGKKLWGYYYTGENIFCLYAPMNGVDTIVTYRISKKNPGELNELYGYGPRWKEEYYNGQDTKGSFWELINSEEYKELYVDYALTLLKTNLSKYVDIFNGFFIRDWEERIKDKWVQEGGDLGGIEKRIRAAKLLLRK